MPDRLVPRPGSDCPGLSDGAYLIREAMRHALATAVDSIAVNGFASREVVLLDIGGRGKPYASLFSTGLSRAGYRVRYLVLDPGPGADAMAMAEALPVASGCADVVLCTQVLEHVLDPGSSVAEMARVLKPGGVCVLTTHGTWFYHPDPEDYWRWTPAGLVSLISRSGFSRVSVEPVGGTKLALAVLCLTAFERAAGQGLAGAVARRLLVTPANWVASRWLMRDVTGRVSLPGELVINYLVTARPKP